MLTLDMKISDYLKMHKYGSIEGEDKVDAVAYSKWGEDEYFSISVINIIFERGYYYHQGEDEEDKRKRENTTLREVLTESIETEGRRLHSPHYYADAVNFYPYHKVRIEDISEVIEYYSEDIAAVLFDGLFKVTEEISDYQLYDELYDRLSNSII